MKTNRELAIDYSEDCFRNSSYSHGDCVNLMNAAQIEILEEVLERYYNQSFSQTIRGLVEDLKKELK